MWDTKQSLFTQSNKLLVSAVCYLSVKFFRSSWLIIGYNLTQTCRFFVTKDCQILFLKKCLSSQHPVYAPITSSCPSVKFMSDIFHPSSVDEWSDMPLCEPISCECDLNLVTMYTCMLQPPWAFHWCIIQTQVMDRCWDIGWNRRTLAINMLMEGCSLQLALGMYGIGIFIFG